MIKVNDKLINKVADILDECAMLYYEAFVDEKIENTAVTNYNVEKPHTNFYECLIKVIRAFLGYEELDVLDDEQQETIMNKLNVLNEYSEDPGLNVEEIRQALNILDVKGYKNVNFPLDIITPDVICIIMYYITTMLYKEDEVITILDPNLGTGNLAFLIANYLKNKIDLIGFENHELLCRVAAEKANLMEREIELHNVDCLEYIPSDLDLIVSDVAAYDYENEYYSSELYNQGVKYFPYLLIEHYLQSSKKINMVLLIDNDFFSQKGSDIFKKMLSTKGNIKALVVLPEHFFLRPEVAKSIIIIDNKNVDSRVSSEIFALPPLEKQEAFMKTLNKLEECLKK